MQIQCSRQPLKIVVIVAHGRACLEPFRLLLRMPRRKVNLEDVYRAVLKDIRYESLLYDARGSSATHGSCRGAAPCTSQCVQIRHEFLQLLLVKLPAEWGHHASATNDALHHVLVRGCKTAGQVRLLV